MRRTMGHVRVGERFTSFGSTTDFALVTDGLSNTAIVGEKHLRPGFFGQNNRTNAGDGPIWNDDGFEYHTRLMGRQVLTGGATLDRQLAQSPQDSFRPGERFGSWHTGVCQFVFGDGSVRALANSTAVTILTLIARPDDGQVIPNS
jgi:hypothetical protein